MKRYTENLYGPWMTMSNSHHDQLLVSAGYKTLSCPDVTIRGDYRRPNPWSYSVLSNNYSKGFISSFVNGEWQSTDSGFFPIEATAFVDTDTIKSTVYNECLSKLAEKIRGQLNAAVSIAEGRQTAKMLNLSGRLTSNLSSMQASYSREIYARLRTIKNRKGLERALRKWESGHVLTLPLARKRYKRARIDGSFVSRASSLGANGWLEFTYGWSPLMSDIRAIGLNVVGRARTYFRATAHAKQAIDETRYEPASHSYGPTRESASGFVAVSVSVTMRPGFDPGLSQWTSLNPLLVGYELIPYSFVFDWAFNLGSYLENLEQALRFQTSFDYGYVTSLVVVDYNFQEAGRTLGTSAYRVANRTANKHMVSMERSLSPSYPVPSFPSVKLDLGSSRLLSAASLLRQLIK